MQTERNFIIWTSCPDEAGFAADKLDAVADEYGTGKNAFRVSIIPDFQENVEPITCPFDTCFLNDRGAAAIAQGFVITRE